MVLAVTAVACLEGGAWRRRVPALDTTLLLSAGADPNIRNPLGATPLLLVLSPQGQRPDGEYLADTNLVAALLTGAARAGSTPSAKAAGRRPTAARTRSAAPATRSNRCSR